MGLNIFAITDVARDRVFAMSRSRTHGSAPIFEIMQMPLVSVRASPPRSTAFALHLELLLALGADFVLVPKLRRVLVVVDGILDLGLAVDDVTVLTGRETSDGTVGVVKGRTLTKCN